MSSLPPVISSLKELVGEEGITASVAIVPLFKLTHDFSLVSEKLARLLESAEAAFVAAACDSASLIGVDAQAVLPQLVSLIGSTDYGTRLAAADAVRAVGSDNRRTRSILRNALDHPEEDVREFAEDLLNDLRENRGPWWWHRLANWLVRPD